MIGLTDVDTMVRISMPLVALLAIAPMHRQALADALVAKKIVRFRAPRIAPGDVAAVKSYVASVRAQLDSKKRYPPGAHAPAACVVKFVLTPAGRVTSVAIVKSSGDPSLDAFVSKLVADSGPFPPPPPVKNFNPTFVIPFAFK